jgi:hypothetical protein
MDDSSGQKNIEIYRKVTKPFDLCSRMEYMGIRPRDTPQQHPTKFRTSQTRKMKSFSRKQVGLHEKPLYTYATLIGFAIISSKEYCLTLNEIYESIATKYPYYKLSDKGWKARIFFFFFFRQKLFFWYGCRLI